MFRLTSYGITPNRLAVLGVNILIFANLLWIMISYLRYLQNKSGPGSDSRCHYEVFAGIRIVGSFRYIYFSDYFLNKRDSVYPIKADDEVSSYICFQNIASLLLPIKIISRPVYIIHIDEPIRVLHFNNLLNEAISIQNVIFLIFLI